MASRVPQWGYALNQWKSSFDDFLRREEHERAFKEIAVCGFAGVELRAGRDRWEPLGNAEEIERNFGSAGDLLSYVRGYGIESIPSIFYDAAMPREEEPFTGRSPELPEEHEGVLRTALDYARLLVELGGSVLVVNPTGIPPSTGPLSDAQLLEVAACWSAVDLQTRALGVRTALHFDHLGAITEPASIERLIELCGSVGIALDTAGLALLGIDPVDFYRRHHSRVIHIHLQDALDDEQSARSSGRRWSELGSEGGTVDFPALMSEVARRGYSGWLIVECQESLDPAASTMLNGWYVREILSNARASGASTWEV